MSMTVEDLLIQYIRENSRNGRLVKRIKEIATELGEHEKLVYNAVHALEDANKIKTKNRSRMGLEIMLTVEEETLQREDAPEQLEKIPVSQLYTHIQQLDYQELIMLRDLIEAQMMKKNAAK